MQRSIDLNCDMGESYGVYVIGNDAAIMDYVSSINIACGFHAGDAHVMRRTVEQAIQKGVAIGAHPGLQDLNGFGRREIKVSPSEVYDIVLYQIGALHAFTRSMGARLHHVKPHGALYNMAARDIVIADAIARAVKDFDPSLLFVGQAGTKLIESASNLGLRGISEVFADRTYQENGLLTPRTSEHSLIHDEEIACKHVLRMVLEKKIMTLQRTELAIDVQTICIHGDGRNALQFARVIHQTLLSNGIRIERP